MKQMTRMLVFDVDGVITDPTNNEVSREVLRYVASDLNTGTAVAFNTGRPYEWVQEHVLKKLTESCPDEALGHLLVVAEMGTVRGVFKKGKPVLEIDPTLSLPQDFIDGVHAVLEAPQPDGTCLAEIMWWDSAKKTMGSLVKWDHVSIDAFNKVRPQVERTLVRLLAKHKLNDFIIGQTTIATDIQHKTTGKHKGAEQVVAWLSERGDIPTHYYAFGDSVSDKAMAETFAATGTKTTFIFVGDPY